MKFKKIAIGFAIFILTVVFIVFVNKAINPTTKYQTCQPSYNNNNYNNYNYSYQDDYVYQTCQKNFENTLKTNKEKGFFIVTMLSVLAIIAGVLVRSVAPVSWGLVMAGLTTLLYIFIANYEEVGKPYRAIVSGVALAFLIWLAYAKLGDKEKIKEQVPTPIPPVASPPVSIPPIN
ncbi:MAG: hypothetical protein US31_C0001G0061 [Berkelbacteria bacterium GW2011_GWA1_36_9]|uniref:Uncharacterized protein n=1 Tax=Berkelbacteria bacterium GW2011_GWA1_36_9 TaxID=1618331 RepID=A0A0G0I3M1_9BACT|nr:MAG: hypothetical protein US31_C0001G0061 [Berkelbacteria bacterium GW2011_GWA1_36_9]